MNERQPLIEDTLISGREHLATVGHALLTEMQLNPSDASGNDSGEKRGVSLSKHRVTAKSKCVLQKEIQLDSIQNNGIKALILLSAIQTAFAWCLAVHCQLHLK